MTPDEAENGSPERKPAMSFNELETALKDENHPRHAEAQRVMDNTVRPAMKKISSSLMPHISDLFKGLRPPTLLGNSASFDPPHSSLHESMSASQRQVDAMMNAHEEARAEKEAAVAAEKAAELAQREADRVEARRQHKVMLGWTIASAGLALAAVVVAVIALFVSGGS